MKINKIKISFLVISIILLFFISNYKTTSKNEECGNYNFLIESESKKNLLNYDLFGLPINKSIINFIKEEVKPYFDSKKNLEIQILSKIEKKDDFLLYKCSSDYSKIRFDYFLDEKKINLDEILKKIKKGIIKINKSKTKINLENGEPLKGLKPIEKNKIAELELFESKQGLFLNSENNLGVYLIQFNKNNLREYTLKDGLLTDKTYASVCREINELENTLFQEVLMVTLFTGFHKEEIERLNIEETTLLFDVVGIGIAEYFKSMETGGLTFSDLMNGYILSAYYNNQGKIINISNSLSLDTVDCLFFQEKFNKRKEMKQLQEKVITRYLKNNHEVFFNKFIEMISYDGENLFESMFYYLETNETNKINKELLKELILILDNNATEITSYSEKTIKYWNNLIPDENYLEKPNII